VDAQQFRTAGYELVDWVADYLESVERLPVSPRVGPGEVADSFPRRPPEGGRTFPEVLSDLDELVLPALTHWQHPRFFAYFPANTSYPSILGELACAGLAVNGMSWATSPACTELEQVVCGWMAELLGLPASMRFDGAGGGVIQDSASSATLCAVLAAREKATEGKSNLQGVPQGLVAYASEEAHSSVEKDMRIAGVGSLALRRVPTDASFAMRPDTLAAMVEEDRSAGLKPFLIVATSGTTRSLGFDPIGDIAEVAGSVDAWLHVDAAMSGAAAICPEWRSILSGVEMADSWCFNPHKWLGVGFDCDLMYVADRRRLTAALSIMPEYLRTAEGSAGAVVDYRDWQIPLGRRFRALKLYFAICLDGAETWREMMRRHVALAQELASWVEADELFELVAPHPLNLVCMALAAGDEATRRLLEAANLTGEALFTRTVLASREVIRFCVGGRATTRSHVEAGWSLLKRLAPPNL
jgi:aromatic-L-amino-acid decarboxylase